MPHPHPLNLYLIADRAGNTQEWEIGIDLQARRDLIEANYKITNIKMPIVNVFQAQDANRP